MLGTVVAVVAVVSAAITIVAELLFVCCATDEGVVEIEFYIELKLILCKFIAAGLTLMVPALEPELATLASI